MSNQWPKWKFIVQFFPIFRFEAHQNDFIDGFALPLWHHKKAFRAKSNEFGRFSREKSTTSHLRLDYVIQLFRSRFVSFRECHESGKFTTNRTVEWTTNGFSDGITTSQKRRCRYNSSRRIWRFPYVKMLSCLTWKIVYFFLSYF